MMQHASLEYGRMGIASRNAMLEELCRFRELFCAAYLTRDITELTLLNKYLDAFARIGR